MAENKVCCATITWTFRPGNPLKPGEREKLLPTMLRQIKEAGYEGVEGLAARGEYVLTWSFIKGLFHVLGGRGGRGKTT